MTTSGRFLSVARGRKRPISGLTEEVARANRSTIQCTASGCRGYAAAPTAKVDAERQQLE
jgi:hypothetical protein